MQIESNGATFNCEVDGPDGAPWVTLSHALANNLTLWDEVVDKLKDRYRVLRYDHRGHGKTPATPPELHSFQMYVDDVLGLWEALEIDKTHWVGLSLGGMIGYNLAIEHPARLRSLIACDSRPDAPPEYAAYFQNRIDVVAAGGMEGVVPLTIERWFTPETQAADPPVLERVREMIRTTDPIGHEGLCRTLKTLSFGPRLHEISVPTLILGGDQDVGAPVEVLEEAAGKISGADHVVIPNACHITALENPGAYYEAVNNFLTSH